MRIEFGDIDLVYLAAVAAQAILRVSACCSGRDAKDSRRNFEAVCTELVS